MERISKEILDDILYDLTDRKGFRHQWDATDEDVREEIKVAWLKIIQEKLGEEFVSHEQLRRKGRYYGDCGSCGSIVHHAQRPKEPCDCDGHFGAEFKEEEN